MIERYRKFGSVVRRENDVLIRVDEAGEAIDRGRMFECKPIEVRRELPAVAVNAVQANADEVAKFKPERFIVSDGVALHEFEGREWIERSTRIHASIARPPYRALVDLASFDVSRVAIVADALTRAKGTRELKRVRLDEYVGAALLPSLIGTIAMQQSAGPRDGKGNPIDQMPVTGADPPNWFRPSYRSRPQRAWFDLRAEPFGEIDRDLPEAIALLAPIDGRRLHLLCVGDGDEPFIASIDMNRVIAATPTTTFLPFGAGCYGAELVVLV